MHTTYICVTVLLLSNRHQFKFVLDSISLTEVFNYFFKVMQMQCSCQQLKKLVK